MERFLALEGLQRCVDIDTYGENGQYLSGPWFQLATPAGAVGCVGIALALLSLLRLVSRNGARILDLVRRYPEEAVSPAFKGKILDAKAEQMRVLVQASCYMLIPVTAWTPWWDPYAFLNNGLSRGIIVAAAQIFLALLAMWPGAVSPKSLDAIYCTLAAFVTLVAFPFNADAGGDPISLLVLVNGFMMALTAVRRTTFMRMPLLVVVNFLFGLSSCSMIHSNQLLFGSPVYFTGAQALLVAVMTVAAPVLERKSRGLLYQLLELEELQELFSASQCLLRSCFDVVVELDAAGRVVGPGQELGTMLLRQQAMEGATFAELLEGSTAQTAFAERLASPTMQALGLAEHMQATLKDALGNSLEIELMWFTFTRSREKHRMLGLRELPSGEVRHEAAAEESVTVLVGNEESEALSRMDVAVSETSSVLEAHSVSSGTAVEAGALVVVDTLACGFPVLRLSASFRARVGPLRHGRRITEALKRPQRFERWLVLSLTSEPAPNDSRVTFKMPQGNVNAFCRLLKSGSSEEDEEEAALLFYGIHAEATFQGEVPGPRPRKKSSSLRSPRHQRHMAL